MPKSKSWLKSKERQMRTRFTTGLFVLGVLTLGMLAGNSAWAQGSAAEKAVTQLEKEWNQCLVSGDASVIERVESPDIINTGNDGTVTNKTKDIEDVRSHNLTAASITLDDLKVRAYGHTAVATYTFTAKGFKYGGKDISGAYRETDTWVESGGKWQVVAAQTTRIAQQ
jgi:ketosteroid isomerase-like protein